MHKRRFNELTLSFALRPKGPLLIKSGQESGADPTLLDMNFVRIYHAALGESTVYLPGSSLKGTLRSYMEKIARTVSEGRNVHPPLSCDPLGKSAKPGADRYACGQYMDRHRNFSPAQKYKCACAICRIFGHTSLASHAHISDAYPLPPDQPSDRRYFEQANQTEERDGVAIDRVSGAVAVGPFNLEVVTQGAFFASLTLSNFQLWQVGLLAIALRDLGRGLVPIGFAKSRGLGRVAVEYVKVEAAYPGRFALQEVGRDYAAHLYGVSSFLSPEGQAEYGFVAEEPPPLPAGNSVSEAGEFGRVALAWQGEEEVTALWRACVPYWRDFANQWQGEACDG